MDETHEVLRNKDTRSSVETEANFEGNDTEILITRLRNPIIKKQIANLMYQQAYLERKQLENEEWESHSFDGLNVVNKSEFVRGRKSGRIVHVEYLEELSSLPLPNIEQLEDDIELHIKEAESKTDIEFSSERPSNRVINLYWENPHTGERLSPKQMSIIEAHEKGHNVRFYDHILTKYFGRGFDISQIEFTEEFVELLRKGKALSTEEPDAEQSNISLEEIRKEYLFSYLFTPREIVERMSQLKNYFGFRADEQFTMEHLQYAKEHYIEDTGMDNAMSLFFQAITPETEAAFLELINNSGI